jgi:hypothetical protein
VSQNEKYLKVFERYHMKIYFEWLEIPCIGICSGLFEITLVSVSWMHEKYSLSVQVKASKRLGSDN